MEEYQVLAHCLIRMVSPFVWGGDELLVSLQINTVCPSLLEWTSPSSFHSVQPHFCCLHQGHWMVSHGKEGHQALLPNSCLAPTSGC